MTTIVRPTPQRSRLVSILGLMALLLAAVSAPASAPHRYLYMADPSWVTFTIDGQYADSSTGDVVDVQTRKIVAVLKDEAGVPTESENLVEIDFDGAKPVRVGNQFEVGRVIAP